MMKDTVPEGFTLSLALMDAVPVLLFSAACLLICRSFPSPLFLAGVVLAIFAGGCKVAWKLVVVLAKKNIPFLFCQMRLIMPLGMLLMVQSVWIHRSMIDPEAAVAAVLSFPACLCFLLFFVGMCAMGVLGARLDSQNPTSNWIEQTVNAAAQGCFLLGVLLCSL